MFAMSCSLQFIPRGLLSDFTSKHLCQVPYLSHFYNFNDFVFPTKLHALFQKVFRMGSLHSED